MSDGPSRMPLHLLESMTDNFSEDRLIGGGSYGKTYLGDQEDGQKIAVKILYDMPGYGDEQFYKEFYNVANLQHQNIVQLVGYCHETGQESLSQNGRRIHVNVTRRALCFEFMENGSIDTYLCGVSNGHGWRVRYAIIKGICNGLKYLHEELKPPIFHLDLNPSCILLDKNMIPKIANFGLSRSFKEQKFHITSRLAGTIGYLPPEFINQNIISNKLDIFSLGVIVIKIITGSTDYSRSADMTSYEFTEMVHGKLRNRLQARSGDLLESYSAQVKRCVEIALRCVEADHRKRPTIGEVVNMLNEAETQQKYQMALINQVMVDEDDLDAMKSMGVHPTEPCDRLQMGLEASSRHCVLEQMLLDKNAGPSQLPLSLLQDITYCFSPLQVIGTGGFAVVYKGMVGKGRVAVKKLTRTQALPEIKFHREVECMMKAKHKNIVRFLGYCAETQGEVADFEGKFVMSDLRNWLLCFEYLPNGSLENYITDTSSGLEWTERFRIIKGICEGLHYLHMNRILHLDLKPPNILLDGHMVPKIADFGLSRCLDEKKTHATTTVKTFGTPGYMAPEIFLGRKITFASDIYSLGSVIMEILTGVKGYPEDENVTENWIHRIEGGNQLQQVRVCTKIGLECMKFDPEKRPVAQHIIDMLDKVDETATSSSANSLFLRA